MARSVNCEVSYGRGKWQKISIEQALDIRERLKRSEYVLRCVECDGPVHRTQTVLAMLKCGELLFEARDDRVIAAPAVAGENFVQKFALTRAGNRP